MGVGDVLYMCDVVKKFTFAISSPDEFLYSIPLTCVIVLQHCVTVISHANWKACGPRATKFTKHNTAWNRQCQL